jgi:NADPH-dependent glutamate synthase beta subunit-like oxidoreductase
MTPDCAQEEFYETLRYFAHEIKATGVDLRLGTRVRADCLLMTSDGRPFARRMRSDALPICMQGSAEQLHVSLMASLIFVDGLPHQVSAEQLQASGAQRVVLATGVTPRKLNIPGDDHPSVLSYVEVLQRTKPVTAAQCMLIATDCLPHQVSTRDIREVFVDCLTHLR